MGVTKSEGCYKFLFLGCYRKSHGNSFKVRTTIMSKRTRSYYSKGQGRAKVTKTTTISRVPRRRVRYSSLRYRRRNFRNAGFIAIEQKFLDLALGQTALTADAGMAGAEQDPATALSLTVPSQGDSETQRDGKQIIAKYIEITGKVGFAGAEAVVNPLNAVQAFVAVVLDKQTNGAQLNSEDVFKNTTASANGATVPQRNLLYGKRFRLLKQVCFDLTPETLGYNAANDFGWQGKERTFRWYIPLNNMKINFTSGTTGVVGNVLDNSVHVIACCNNTASAPYILYNSRFRFCG